MQKRWSKGESLEMLAKGHLNTPVFAIFRKPFKIEEMIKSLEMFPDKVSIRTWSSGKFLCPFYPNRPKPEVSGIVEGLADLPIEEIILSEGIDPQNSQRCGKTMHLWNDQDNFATLEYFEGPGTVRDLDNKSADERKTITIPRYGFNAPELWMVYFMSKARPFFRIYPGTVLEWSYYPYLIGRKQDNLIFWEVL